MLSTTTTTNADSWLAFGPDIKWKQVLQAGPQAVCVLGQVLLVANAGSDFRLDLPVDGHKYEYLRWTWFRPALLGVVHDAHDVFVLADTNMGAIRNIAAMLPRCIEDLRRCVRNSDPKFVAMHAPSAVRDVRAQAIRCFEKSLEVKQRFDSSIGMLNELLQACCSTNSTYEEKKRQNELHLAVNADIRQGQEEIVASNKALLEDMKKKADDAKRQYDEALARIPTGWELIGMEITKGLTGLITGHCAPAGVMREATSRSAVISSVAGGSNSDEIAAGTGSGRSGGGIDPGYAMAEQIDKMLKALRSALSSEGKKLQDTKAVDSKGPEFVQAMLGRLQQDLERINAPSKHVAEAIILCRNGQACAKAITEMGRSIKTVDPASQKLDRIRQELNKLSQRSTRFVAQAIKASGAVPKMDAPKSEAPGQSSDSFSRMVLESAHQNLETAKYTLAETLKGATRAQEMYNESSNKLTAAIAEMSSLKLKDIHFSEIRRVLEKAIRALGQLSIHWHSLASFFRGVYLLIESASLSTESLLGKIQVSEKGGRVSVTFDRQGVENAADEALQQQAIIYRVAKLYKEISTGHLLDPLSKLNLMITVERDQTERIESMMGELASQCATSQKAIQAVFDEESVEYAKAVALRIQELDKQIAELPLDQATKEAITSAVHTDREEGQDTKPLVFAEDRF